MRKNTRAMQLARVTIYPYDNCGNWLRYEKKIKRTVFRFEDVARQSATGTNKTFRFVVEKDINPRVANVRSVQGLECYIKQSSYSAVLPKLASTENSSSRVHHQKSLRRNTIRDHQRRVIATPGHLTCHKLPTPSMCWSNTHRRCSTLSP